MNPQVTQLSLFDIVGTKGVAADVSHINTKAKTTVSTRQPNPSAALGALLTR